MSTVKPREYFFFKSSSFMEIKMLPLNIDEATSANPGWPAIIDPIKPKTNRIPAKISTIATIKFIS